MIWPNISLYDHTKHLRFDNTFQQLKIIGSEPKNALSIITREQI